jgi:uroporphyrinogen decarboxylase
MAKTFSRRERVATALNHREPDRVPCDLTIAPDAYKELCDHLGERFEPYWWDDWNHAYPSASVLEKLNVDVYHLEIGATPRGYNPDLTEFKDAWGNTKRKLVRDDGSFMYCIVDTPLAGAKTIDDIESYPWPKPEDIINIDGLEERARHLYEETDFALTAVFGGNVFERPHYMSGIEDYFVRLVTDPRLPCAMMDKVLGIQMAVDKMVLGAIGKYITYMRFNGEDVGSQMGPLISPNVFRRLVRPRLEKEWRAAKEEFLKHNPDGKISMHSCGSVIKFLPIYIEMGVDMVNPIQPNAADMDSKEIKEQFGSQLCFHGAVNTQDVLTRGTRQDVFNEVRTRIRDLAPGGGYILAPSHNIQFGMPPENVVALFEAVQEFGRYPIKC